MACQLACTVESPNEDRRLDALRPGSEVLFIISSTSVCVVSVLFIPTDCPTETAILGLGASK